MTIGSQVAKFSLEDLEIKRVDIDKNAFRPLPVSYSPERSERAHARRRAKNAFRVEVNIQESRPARR